MMLHVEKKYWIGGLILIIILVGGFAAIHSRRVLPAICGDGICEKGESYTCPSWYSGGDPLLCFGGTCNEDCKDLSVQKLIEINR